MNHGEKCEATCDTVNRPDDIPVGDIYCLPRFGCSDTCASANDGTCDDGGNGATYATCDLGTDCTDCGARTPNNVVDRARCEKEFTLREMDVVTMGVFPPPGYPVCSQISIRLYDSFGDGWYGHVSGTGKVEPPSKINFTNAVTGAPIIGACIAGACVQNSWQYLTNLYKTGKDSDGNLDKGQDIYYVHSSGGSSGAIRWSWNTTYNYNSENKIMFACHDTDPAQYTVFTSSNDHSLVRGTYDEWVSGTYEGKIHTFAAPGSGVPIWDEVTTTGATKKWYGITSSADGTKLAAVVGLSLIHI